MFSTTNSSTACSDRFRRWVVDAQARNRSLSTGETVRGGPAPIAWSACTDSTLKSHGAECGYLSVPMDYTKPGGRKSDREEGHGAGGGGNVEAIPAGFIEIGPAGATFHEIRDPERTGRLLKAGAAAATTLLAGFAGARRLRGARGPKGLLNR